MKKLIAIMLSLLLVMLALVSCAKGGADGDSSGSEGGENGSSEGSGNGESSGDEGGSESGGNTGSSDNEGGSSDEGNTDGESGNEDTDFGDGNMDGDGWTASNVAADVALCSAEGKADYGDATVYLEGDEVMLVLGGNIGTTAVINMDYWLTMMGVDVKYGNQYMNEHEYEIIVGEVPERAVSEKAYRLLNRMDRDGIFDCRYLVYAENGIVAIAYDVNEYTKIQGYTYVIEELVKKYFENKDYFATAKGILIYGNIDLKEKQKEIDEAELTEIWAEIDARTNDDVYNALRDLYTMYDDRLIGWYANLYDPGYGAYYSSSSGRDHEGYYPSAEPTAQALNFLASCGMLDNYNNRWINAIPDIMKYRLVYYIKSLQHPNGYFYDPGVSKANLDSSGRTRLGRDLGWCTSMLETLGEKPTYNTPLGDKGDGKTPDEYWASLGLDIAPPVVKRHPADDPFYPSITLGSLSDSATVAVSKVVSASEVVATAAGDFISSFENFIDYLEGLNMDGNPYSAGNDINASDSQIFAASKKMGVYTPAEGASEKYTKYAGLTMNEILLKYLNSKINPNTGLHGLPTDKYPNGTEFLYTNGFFKLIGVYSALGEAYPYPIEAANALLDGMVSDQPSTTNICEVYNIWSAIQSLRSNVQRFNKTNKQEVLDLINETLAVRGAEAIRVSHQKQLGYKKPDGAYSHRVVGSGSTIQGSVPVALGGLEEGIVDAIGKATIGLAPIMTSMLNLPDIPLYTEYHWMMYLEIIVNLDPVIKYSYSGTDSALGEPHNMDALPGSSYMSQTLNDVASVKITQDGEESVLLLDKVSTGKQSFLTFLPNISNVGASIAEFSTRLRISGTSGNSILTFSFAPKNAGHENRVARISLAPSSDGSIRLYEEEWAGSGSSAKVGSEKYVIAPKVGEWFNFRIQYFEGDGVDYSTARIKIYINDTLAFCSNDFYSKWSDAGSVNSMTVLCMSGFFGKVWLDDTMLELRGGTTEDDPLTEPDAGEEPSTPDTPTVPDTPTTPTTPEPEGGFGFISSDKLPLTSGGLELIDGTAYSDAASVDGVVTDASGNTVSQWKGSIVITGEEDKFLRITDVATGSTKNSGACTEEDALNKDVGQAILKMTGVKATGNKISYSMKIRFNPLEDGTRVIEAKYFDFRIRNISGSKGVQVFFATDAEGVARCIIKTASGDVTESTEIKVEDGNWMNVRLEYTAVGDSYDAANYSIKLYVNDTVLAETTAQSANGFDSPSSMNAVQIVLTRTLQGIIDIDDMYVSYE